MRVDRGLGLGRAIGAIALAAGAFAPGALAASSPSPGVSASTAFPGVEAWLDSDVLGPDAPAGETVEAGITFWDTASDTFARVGGVAVLLHPANGAATPNEAAVQSDFPGHIVVSVVVPEGGAGTVEIGVPAQTCTADGTCSEASLPLPIAGSGPPPGAEAADLLDGRLHPIVGDVVAGREFPIAVDVVGRGLWPADSLPLPEHLLAIVTERGGADVGSTDLRPGTQPGAPYAGRLTIQDPGQLSLTVALPRTNGESHVLAGATTGLKVIDDPARASAVPGAAEQPTASDGSLPTVIWLAAIAVLLVGGIAVARRVLADL